MEQEPAKTLPAKKISSMTHDETHALLSGIAQRIVDELGKDTPFAFIVWAKDKQDKPEAQTVGRYFSPVNRQQSPMLLRAMAERIEEANAKGGIQSFLPRDQQLQIAISTLMRIANSPTDKDAEIAKRAIERINTPVNNVQSQKQSG